MDTKIKINYTNKDKTIGSNIDFKGFKKFNMDDAVIYYNNNGVLFDLDKSEIKMLEQFTKMCKKEPIKINIKYNDIDGDYFIVFKCEDIVKQIKTTLELKKYEHHHKDIPNICIEITANVLLNGLKTMLKKQKSFSVYFEEDKPILLLDDQNNYIAIAIMI